MPTATVLHIADFNSRTHVECDPTDNRQINCQPTFQLTHSRGVRLSAVLLSAPPHHFNSRTHVECDNSESENEIAITDFNSRTHVECDAIGVNDGTYKNYISTHALTWSATESDTA